MNIKPITSQHKTKLFLGGYLFGIIVLMVLISPTINNLPDKASWLYLIFYMLLGAAIFINLIILKRYDGLAIIIAGFIFIFAFFPQGFVKAAIYSLVLAITYVGFIRFRQAFINTNIILIIVNYIITLGQLSGYFGWMYSWINYANEAVPHSIFLGNVPAAFLPQIRPSGLFPSPTFLSCYMILLFSLILFEKELFPKVIQTLIGSLFALSGSSLGYVLIALIAFSQFHRLGFVKWILISYISTVYLYQISLPQLAEYNFSIADFFSSVINRIVDESILVQNPVLLITMIILIIIAMWSSKFEIISHFNSLAAPCIILMPLILHNIVSSLMYSVMLGVGLGIFSSSFNWPKVSLVVFSSPSNIDLH